MEPKTRRPRPKRHYEPKLSLYPLKFEDALKKLAKTKPEKRRKSTS